MDSEKWEELLKVGIGEIDNEHQLIHHMIQQLRSMLGSAGRNSLPGGLALSTLQQLMVFIRKHFANEEELMLESHYPGFDQHKHEHDLFLEHLEDVERRAPGQEVVMIVEFLNSLSNWFQHHVLEVDKKLGFFLLEKTIAARNVEDPEGGAKPPVD